MPETIREKILITGAGSGIGAATARLLGDHGIDLVLVDCDLRGLQQFDKCEKAVGRIEDPEFWSSLDLAGLTGAMLSAGVARGGTAIADLAFDEWRDVMSTNLDGTFLSLRAAMAAIRATGRGGAAVLLSSSAGLKPSAGIAPYATSKAALIALMKVAAIEGASDKIRVNAIAPAGVETPIWTGQQFFAELAKEHGGEAAAFAELAKGSNLFNRFASAEEIAGQIAFLLSDAARNITGTCLVSDGGYTLA